MSQPVCAIIGAGEGLGQSLARKFAAEGCAIALISRSAAGSAAALAAAQRVAATSHARFFKADATDPHSVEAACAAIESELGPIEILIYNARGGYDLRAPLAMTYAELDEIFRLEVLGAFAAAKAVMPGMIKRGHGTLLYSSATAAYRGSGTNPLFAIGKFGLRALTQSLAKAYAKDGLHIAHIRLDCTLDVPLVREMYGAAFKAEDTANTDDVAMSYWWVYQQPRSAWSNEVELRPYTENWTY